MGLLSSPSVMMLGSPTLCHLRPTLDNATWHQRQAQLSNLAINASLSPPDVQPFLLTRRDALFAGVAVVLGVSAPCAPVAAREEVPASVPPANELIERLLERSRANKAKHDKERLDDYYKRNFKDYFEFVEGSIKNKQALTEAERGIVEWLKKNR